MPIFMDRHNIAGITAEHVAEAHQIDLKVQDQYNCKVLTYWFDEKSGVAFCLVDAPTKEAVVEMHNNAHGLVPNQIIKVESNLVRLFLGRITDPQNSNDLNSVVPTINETGFRTILNVEIKNLVMLITKNKKDDFKRILSLCNNVIQNAFEQYNGNETKAVLEGHMASFVSVTDFCNCALNILNEFNLFNKSSKNKIYPVIGLCTGAPVTEKKDLFGKTIQMVQRLCEVAKEGQIWISTSVREFYDEIELSLLYKEKSVKILKPTEEIFLNKLMDFTELVWNEENLDVRSLCTQIGLSKSQLYRKITSLTGYTPNEFIKQFRLKRALKLIEKQESNISQIAYETGFSDPSYFSKCFHKQFGILPSDYANVIA